MYDKIDKTNPTADALRMYMQREQMMPDVMGFADKEGIPPTDMNLELIERYLRDLQTRIGPNGPRTR